MELTNEQRRRLYKPALSHEHGHMCVYLKVLDRVWELISASPISGQMSFKDMTDNLTEYTVKEMGEGDKSMYHKGEYDEEDDHWTKRGVTGDGTVLKIAFTCSHQDIIIPVANSLRILGMPLGKKVFLTGEAADPVVSDGPNSYAFRLVHGRGWNGGQRKTLDTIQEVIVRPLYTKKHYKVVYDPASLSWEGKYLTPLTEVFRLIDENVEVFADPFEIRNTSRTKGRANEVKTIRPGLRQQVVKMTGRKRKLAGETTIVDEVTQ